MSSSAGPVHWKQKFGRWLHKHNLLLALVGALIVFATFIAKEGFREELKNLADSIDAAEAVFRSDAETGQVLALLNRLYQDLDPAHYDTVPGESRSKTMAGEMYSTLLPSMSDRYSDFVLDRGRAARLIEKLPRRDSVQQLLDKVDAELYDPAKALNAIQEKWNSYFPPPHADKEWSLKFQELGDGIDNARNKLDLLMVDVLRLQEEVIHYSEVTRREAERRYKVFKWVSYGLYTVGWALAFVGRLYGLAGLGGVD